MRSFVAGSLTHNRSSGSSSQKRRWISREALGGDCAALQAAIVNPFLNGDMRFRLKLEVALGGILAVLVFEGALDVDRVGVVSFNKVAVVAVHRPHEIGEGGQQTGWQAAAKAGGSGQDREQGRSARCGDGIPRQSAAAPSWRRVTSVFDPIYVLFFVHFRRRHKLLYISMLLNCQCRHSTTECPL